MFWLPESRGTKRRLQSLWGQPQLRARPAHCTMVPRGTLLPVCSPPHCEERKAQRDEAMDSSTTCKWEPGSWHSNSGAACTMFATSKQHPEVRSLGDRQALPYMSRWLWLNSRPPWTAAFSHCLPHGTGQLWASEENERDSSVTLSIVVVQSLNWVQLFVTPCSPDSSVLHYLPVFAQTHV